MFFFLFDESMKNLEEETTESILKARNEIVKLDDIPYTELTKKYPGYYEWYALEEEESIRVFRHEIGLYFESNNGKGLTNLEYYNYGYSYVIKKYVPLVNRQDCYRLVEKYHEGKYRGRGPHELIIPKEEVSYRVDKFYRNIREWGRLKWDGIIDCGGIK